MSVVLEPVVTTWKIDPAHTAVQFAARHLMITTVRGRFTDVSGTVRSVEHDPAKGEADITINTASIDTREPQRDAHLRSADFFEADKYPTITFRSKRVEDVRGEDFTLVGDLTMHGVTREVVLDVSSEGRVTDPWGGERAGFSAKTTVKRSDFGLTWNQLLETGGVAVGDDIKIEIDAELVKV